MPIFAPRLRLLEVFVVALAWEAEPVECGDGREVDEDGPFVEEADEARIVLQFKHSTSAFLPSTTTPYTAKTSAENNIATMRTVADGNILLQKWVFKGECVFEEQHKRERGL